MKKTFLTLFSALCLLSLKAQIADVNPFAAQKIPAELKKNAHAVVRQYELSFEVKNKGEAIETEHKVVTLLDEKAAKYSEPVFWYDKIRQIEDIEASVYDGAGKLIRKMKKKDIDDFKPFDDGVDDNRAKRITFPRLPFPYTIEYQVVTKHKGLLHYPVWRPQEQLHEAVERAVFNITKSADVQLRFKEMNLPKGAKLQNGDTYRWYVENLNAVVDEPFTPSVSEPFPQVLVAPDVFTVEGFSGRLDSWQNFGKFQAELNKGRSELPQTVINELRKLVEDCPDDYCKIERVYKKLQNTTRYFSIQLGIGGWQPILAGDVDRRKYGDCKALSNYMVAMLHAVHIEGQYVIVKAGEDNQVQYPDFPNAYFNHVIACVPMANDTVWLECTSQTTACGYLGTFTDSRPALLIAPDGGHLVKTPVYDEKSNVVRRNVKITLNTEGGAQLDATSIYSGTKQELPGRLSEFGADFRKKIMYEWLKINDFEIKNLSFKRHLSRLPSVEETMKLDIRQLGSVSGKRQFVPVNLLSVWKETFATDSVRRFDIQADSRGFTEMDSIVVAIPTGFKVETLPDPLSINALFGTYQLKSQVLDKNNVLVTRQLIVNNKIFPAKNQTDLAQFFKQIAKADKVKMVLVKE
jgi:Domain of Unknown Function with PDB structure (DUF3857)